MRIFILLMFFTGMIFANYHPYKKEILISKPIEKATLIQVKLDNELYNESQSDYANFRLYSSHGIEGYFVQAFREEVLPTHKVLKAKKYNRKEATLLYVFSEPFDVERIELHIEDRNFESTFDVYIDNKLLLENQKIFDYSQETGTQNFTIFVPKTKAKELKIVYHLDKTTSFYKKYQNLREYRKYLTIKDVGFFNNNKRKKHYNKTAVSLFSKSLKDKKSIYFFKSNKIPFEQIEVHVQDKNFKRSGKIYGSDDNISWQYLKTFTLMASSLSNKIENMIDVKQRVKYLKLEIENHDDKALNIKKIVLFFKPNYLYFVAHPKEKYHLYFGQKYLKKPVYELESLISNNIKFIQAKFSKIEMLEVEKIKIKEKSFVEENKEIIFILVVLFAVLIMGYIAFILLKKD